MSAVEEYELLARPDAIVFAAQPATLELEWVAGGVLSRLGFGAAEWLANPTLLTERLPCAEREALASAMRATADDGVPRRLAHPLLAADGSARWFSTEIEAIEGGRRLLGVMIDATSAHANARALRDAEQRLRHVVEHAPVILFALDSEGRFTLAEGAGLRTLHLVPADMLGRSALELMADEATVPGHIRRALAGESLVAIDYVRAFDSWWETRWAPLHVDGRPSGAIAVALEVSARYHAESELAQTVSLLRATLEATTDGILVVSTAGRIVDFNRQFLEMWRIPPEVLHTRDAAQAVHFVLDQLRDADAFLAQVRALYAEPEAISHDMLEFRDGRLVARDSQPQLVNGRCVGRVWSFRDVTAEHRAALRNAFLADASKLLSNMLTDDKPLESVARLAVPYLGDWCGILLYDGLRRLYSTAAHHRDVKFVPLMHQIQLTEISPDSGLGVIVLQARPVVFNDLSEAELSGEPSPRRAVTVTDPERLAQLRAIGLRHWMGVPLMIRGEVVGALLFGSGEETRRYDALDLDTAQDLAQRAALALENQQLYRAAHEAVALRDDFVSVASHELRTPMTSLQLAIQSALAVGFAPDTPPGFMRRALESAERQTRRLGRLVDSLLDVSRIEAGRLELARDTVDLAQLVRETVRVLGEDLQRAGCPVMLELPESLPGQWDRVRLEQVVTNLLSNAFKYGAGKPIDVTLRAEGELARLSVRDRGIGVPKHERGRIFERFERAVSARHYGGLGLGLYIVRRIVDAHGGKVMVCDVVGEGAEFIAELPLGG